MKILLCLLSFVVILVSCNEDTSEPCEWYQSSFKAKVDKIEFDKINSEGDSVFIVWVDFSSGSLSSELQDLGKLRGIEFTRKKMAANSAIVGLSYTGTISDLKSGSCETPVISFDQRIR